MPVSPELRAKFEAELDRRGLRQQFEQMQADRFRKGLVRRAGQDILQTGSGIMGLLTHPWESGINQAVEIAASRASGQASVGGGVASGLESIFGAAPIRAAASYAFNPGPSAALAGGQALRSSFLEHPVNTPLEFLGLYAMGKEAANTAFEKNAAGESYRAAARAGEADLLNEAISGRRAAQASATESAYKGVAARRDAATASAAEARIAGPIRASQAIRDAKFEFEGRLRTILRPQAEAVANQANQIIGDAARTKTPLTPVEVRRLVEQVRLEMENRKMFPQAPESGMPFPPDEPFPRSAVEQMFKSLPERVFTGEKAGAPVTPEDVLSAYMGNERVRAHIQAAGVKIGMRRVAPEPLALPAPDKIYGEGFTMEPGKLLTPAVDMSKTKILPSGVRDYAGAVTEPKMSAKAQEFRAQNAPKGPAVIKSDRPQPEPFAGKQIAPDAQPLSADIYVPESGKAVFRGGVVGQAFKRIKNQAGSMASKMFVGEIGRVFDDHHIMAGEHLEALRNTRLYRAPAEIQDMVGRELGGVDTGNPAAKMYAKQIRPILNKIADEAEARGMMVERPDGSLRPWSRREDYFPHIMRREVYDALFNDNASVTSQAVDAIKKTAGGDVSRDQIERTINRLYEAGQLKTSKYTADAIESLMKSGTVKSAAEAMSYLGRRSVTEKFRFFGNVDASRASNLPAHFFETNASNALTDYIYGASRRLAEAKTWGPRSERLLQRLQEIGRTGSQDEMKFFQDVADVFVGNKDREFYASNPSLAKLYERYVDFSAATKIGLGTAVLPNLTQMFISSVPPLGFMRNATAAMKVAFDPEYRSHLRGTYGAVVDESMRKMMQIEYGGTEGALTAKLMAPFTGVNKGLKYLSAASMEGAWNDLLSAAKAGDKKAIRLFGRLGLSPESAATEAGKRRGIFRFATVSQLQKNILEEPLLFNNPHMKPLLLFKRFGVRQAAYIKDWVWDEVRGGNAAPLLRLLAGGYAGGKFVGWAKDNLKAVLSGKPVVKTDDPMWRDAVDAFSQVGALGVLSDIMRVHGELPEDILNSIKDNAVFAITPVPVSDAQRAIKVAGTFATEAGRRGIPQAALRAGVQGLQQFGGSLTSAAAEHLKPRAQVEDEIYGRRGNTQAKINALYGRRDFDAAIRVFKSWNGAFPQAPVHLPDPDEFMDLYRKDQLTREGLSAKEREAILNR